MPVAQTLVLRRVLTGGISTNSGRVFFRGTQYGHFSLRGTGVLERCGGGNGRFSVWHTVGS